MSQRPLRLAFMGTPPFAAPTLDALAAAGHDIAQVYTQPPRPAGRGKNPRPSAVHIAADALGLAVATPERFRGAEALEAFAALGLDAAIVVAYGQILPRAALDAPRLGCLNLHPSLLPRWRGAAPIQRAVMAGDTETAAAIMLMSEGLDEGPVLAEARTPIGPEETAGALHDRLAALGAALMVGTLARLDAGEAEPRAQSDAGVLYAAKISKDEARIDWSEPAARLSARIRGLSPFPGAWFELAGERVKALGARWEPAATTAGAEPGALLDDALLVAAGDTAAGGGAVRLLALQRAGRGAASAEAFLRGRALPIGSLLN